MKRCKHLATALLALLVATIGCHKKAQEPPYLRTDFFRSPLDAFQQVGKALQMLHPGDSLLALRNIGYVDTKQQSCAFVYFNSREQGESNLVFQRLYAADGLVSGSYVTCTGTGCECKVKTIFKPNGDVNLECSCSTCTIHTTPLP